MFMDFILVAMTFVTLWKSNNLQIYQKMQFTFDKNTGDFVHASFSMNTTHNNNAM